MRKNTILISFFMAAVSLVSCRIVFENGLQDSLLNFKQTEDVLVEASFEMGEGMPDYQKKYVALKAVQHSKKAAYMELKNKYNGVVKTLINIKAIPNRDSMIHSIVHKKFLKNSRKWEFTQYLLIYAPGKDMSFIMSRIAGYQPRTINKSVVTQYLSEKMMAITAFTKAKVQLQNFIKNHLDSSYRILLTKDVEIVGRTVENQQLIEDDLEQEFNQEEENRRLGYQEDRSDVSGGSQRQYHHSSSLQRTIKIKVLFQLVDQSYDVQELLEELERQQQSESISDFEEDLRRIEGSQQMQQRGEQL